MSLTFDDRPAQSFQGAAWPLKSAYRYQFKRLLDVVLVLLSAPLTLPVLLLLALMVRRDGGPAFFGHMRVGCGGSAFRCWKIRTMSVDADPLLIAHLASDPTARREWAECQKLQNDPRVTALGGFLRRSSLDELPQLWCVLRGSMTLVGPRPVTEDELDRYGSARHAYLHLVPGVTGLWQVSGRNNASYDERVLLDISYARDITIRRDLAILWRTVGVVLSRTGI